MQEGDGEGELGGGKTHAAKQCRELELGHAFCESESAFKISSLLKTALNDKQKCHPNKRIFMVN